MTHMEMPKFDKIGIWSEIKLDIIKDYATEYTKILEKQKLHYSYIDAFSGAGIHLQKQTNEVILGSPINALNIKPRFKEYHLIDLDKDKIEWLKNMIKEKGYKNVHCHNKDCNDILINKILPNIQFKHYKRALCILDPYGLQLDWNVIKMAGESEVIDIFLNFPTMDINRNALWRNPEGVPEAGLQRMNRFWGDESWKDVAYTKPPQMDLFDKEKTEKASNDYIAQNFCD